MSQKKVDRYKEEKANREKIMKKQKLMHRLEMSAITLVLAAVVVWFGFSVYQKATGGSGSGSAQETILDTSAVQDYLSDLQSTDSGNAE